MILIYHRNNKINEVIHSDYKEIVFRPGGIVSKEMLRLANLFPNEQLVWCHVDNKNNINFDVLQNIESLNRIMMSYAGETNNFLSSKIGYIDESVFINVNKKVRYPTWQMNSAIGTINASVFKFIEGKIPFDTNFDYFLTSIAKTLMPCGLLCYSEPALLLEIKPSLPEANINILFRFVKQHYKTRWVILLFLNLLLYERRLEIAPLLQTAFFRKRNKNFNFSPSINQFVKKTANLISLDVIIPTIGRKIPLYNFLLDLKTQTHLPKTIIIVEQNSLPEGKTELDYLASEHWPFEIKHKFINQSGVCNARNIALNLVSSDWVFFADDDIRISDDFIEKTFENLKKFDAKAVSLSCLQEGQKPLKHHVFQWEGFGSGCSFVINHALKGCQFNTAFEYGFGEDSDFGKQLRNNGIDILFFPQPDILHLKAPIGGFRTNIIREWDAEAVQPKPSPTVMLFIILHNTKAQLLGYKTTLFFKYYRIQKTKNPFRYYKIFQQQWQQSLFWANKLKHKKG